MFLSYMFLDVVFVPRWNVYTYPMLQQKRVCLHIKNIQNIAKSFTPSFQSVACNALRNFWRDGVGVCEEVLWVVGLLYIDQSADV